MLKTNIKQYRKKLRLTQEALSRRAGISYNTIIKLESGAIADPRMGTLRQLSRALGVTIDRLVN
jgi:transcriptional regulator with XRE-family HTH domain